MISNNHIDHICVDNNSIINIFLDCKTFIAYAMVTCFRKKTLRLLMYIVRCFAVINIEFACESLTNS